MSTSQLEAIIKQVETLPIEEQEALLSHLENLLAKTDVNEGVAKTSAGLVYGKYHNFPGRMSTEEDFKIAEWRPTDKELNGE
jgi:hypothetical protein